MSSAVKKGGTAVFNVLLRDIGASFNDGVSLGLVHSYYCISHIKYKYEYRADAAGMGKKRFCTEDCDGLRGQEETVQYVTSKPDVARRSRESCRQRH